MSRTRASAVFSLVGVVAVLAGSASHLGGMARGLASFPQVTWAPKGLPPDRIWAATTFIPDTCELIAYGGSGVIVQNTSSDTLVYYPPLNEWTILSRQKSGGPPPLVHAALTWDADRRVAVLFGGASASASNQTFGFEPTTRRWTALIGASRCTSCPAARAMHAQTWSTTLGATLVFGGVSGSSGKDRVVWGDMWALKASPDRRGKLTWTWSRQVPSAGTPVPEARYAHGIAEIPDGSGRILIYGGWNQSGQALSDTWIYDPQHHAFQQIETNPPTARVAFAMGYLPSLDAIVIQGGQSNPFYTDAMIFVNETWAFDSASLTWERLTTTTGESVGNRAFHDLASNTCDGSAIIFDQPMESVPGGPIRPMWTLR